MGYRFYGNIEEANKEALTRIEAYRTAAGYVPGVTRILKEFDNKVYNCRLTKALEAATNNRVHAEKTEYNLCVYTWPEHGFSYRITLATIPVSEMTDRKRIPADKLISSMREKRECLPRKAYDLETNMNQVGNIKAYVSETIEKLETYLRSLPEDLRDIYGLPYYIRTS